MFTVRGDMESMERDRRGVGPCQYNVDAGAAAGAVFRHHRTAAPVLVSWKRREHSIHSTFGGARESQREHDDGTTSSQQMYTYRELIFISLPEV